MKGTPSDFFPTSEQVIVLVEHETISSAEGFIKSCEQCNPENAEWPFNVLLDRIIGSDPRVTDYILESSARCPGCLCEIHEKTLIEPT